MSSLWREVPGEGWETVPVVDGHLRRHPDVLVDGVRLIALGRCSEGGTGLLVYPGTTVRVNGLPVPGGFRVLEHKDEILAGQTRFYFSAEAPPLCVVYRSVEGTRTPTCPVCRGAIKDGEHAVQCPGCARWYHQLDADEKRRAKQCWSYAPTCRFCNHPTALTGGPVWRPEREEIHA